ncbi:hypothetical protein ACX9R5_06595 [Rathayibacter sp. CAU 1779]
MKGPQPMRYSLTRPQGWVACLPSSDLASPAALAEFVDQFDFRDVARERFELDLARLAEFASHDTTPNRLRWLYVPEPATGTIVATMTVDLVQDRGASPEELAESLSRADSPEGTDVWNRGYEVKRLAGRKAVSGHELIQVSPPDGEASQLNERYLAVVFTPVIGVVLELSISTYDLARFDDIVAYGDRVTDSIQFLGAEAAA